MTLVIATWISAVIGVKIPDGGVPAGKVLIELRALRVGMTDVAQYFNEMIHMMLISVPAQPVFLAPFAILV